LAVRHLQDTEWRRVTRKRLQDKAGEFWESFSYIDNVVNIMIQWVSGTVGDGPRVTDLGAERVCVSCPQLSAFN